MSSVNSKPNIFCGFCKRNGEMASVYQSHILKDKEGRVVCPTLRRHICELCGATGDEAHTRSYCEFAKMGRNDPFFREMFRPTASGHSFCNMVSLKTTRVNSAGKIRKHH